MPASARADDRLGVVVDVVLPGVCERTKSKSLAVGIGLRARQRVDRIVDAAALEEVGAADLEAVVDPRRGQHALVPLVVAEHATHVVGQRLVAGAVVRGIVALAGSCRTTASSGRPARSARRRRAGRRTRPRPRSRGTRSSLDRRRRVLREVDRHLERQLDGRAVERERRAGATSVGTAR